jgi:glycosyltransferase involved in cell wall biosynthesis
MSDLTVIVPARDAAATLGTTLDGLLAHPDVAEVIVVDDGSVDATAAVAIERGARVLASPGLGPSAARNRGAAAATTALLAFCDADDEWIAPVPDPRVALLATDPELDGAWGQTICRSPGPPVADAAPTHLGALHGLVLRRAAFEQVGDFDEDLRLGEDLDWILRSRAVGLHIAMLEVPCYRYLLHPGSLSSGPGRRASGLLAAARRAAARTARDPAPAPVSVVVPVADGARYLPAALASISSQVPAPTELVVGDDASTDASAAIARERGAEVVQLDERRGPNEARTAAIERCSAPLVAFCDADDLWPPGRLATLLDALDAHPDAAGVIGAVEAFASPDRDVSAHAIPAGPQPGSVIGSLLIRRADLDAVGGLRTDLLTGELVALERALAAAGRHLVRIDAVVLHRRVHGDNLTIHRADEVQRAYLRLAVEGARRPR